MLPIAGQTAVPIGLNVIGLKSRNRDKTKINHFQWEYY